MLLASGSSPSGCPTEGAIVFGADVVKSLDAISAKMDELCKDLRANNLSAEVEEVSHLLDRAKCLAQSRDPLPECLVQGRDPLQECLAQSNPLPQSYVQQLRRYKPHPICQRPLCLNRFNGRLARFIGYECAVQNCHCEHVGSTGQWPQN